MLLIECQSLKRLTLVRIATLLWKQHYVERIFRQRIRHPPRSIDIIQFYHRYLKEIENCVLEDVRKLPLPKKLEYEVSCYIRPLGVEIICWKDYEHFKVSDAFRKVCWTPQGTIDNRKTAEALVKDQDVDLPSRYKLACIYCLERDIQSLWDQMPESERSAFRRRLGRTPLFGSDVIVNFWCSVMAGSAFRSPYIHKYSHNYVFQFAAKDGLKDAAEYLLQKLSPEEKCQCLVRTAISVSECLDIGEFNIRRRCRADVLCFLFSRMDREQQIHVIATHPYHVLCLFLDWPWQSILLDAVNLTLNKLTESQFHFFLKRIVDKIQLGYEDYNYRALIGQLWSQSLRAHRRYMFTCKQRYTPLLLKLLRMKDGSNIKLILADATSEEKQEFISHHSKKCICHHYLNCEIWDTFKIIVRECISNTNEMEKFKDDVRTHVSSFSNCYSTSLNKFFKFIDYFHDDERRIVEYDPIYN